MPIRTFSANILVASSFNGPLTNATQNGTGVDTRGYRRAALIVDAYTGVATTFNFILQDSPDNATWTTVTGGTLGAAVVASTVDYVQVVDIDLAKRQRYVRAQIVGTGAAGNASADMLLYGPFNAGVVNINAITL